MKLEGLTEFQEQLLSTAQQTPKAIKTVMNKVGAKATQKARKKAKTLVKKDTGLYQKKWKKGKVFLNDRGEWVVRVINSAPHAHLVEHGHLLKRNNQIIGFVPGKKVLEKSTEEFERSGEMDKAIGDALDNLLSRNKL